MNVDVGLVGWGALIGTLAPLFIAIVQQPRWTGSTRVVVSIIASAILGFGTAAAAGDLSSPKEIGTAALAVLLATMTTYRNIWKPSGIASAIETKTSATPKAV